MAGTDPRTRITLRHILNMASGLEPVDDNGLEYATGSGLSYWAGASSTIGARSRPLAREPGTAWNYENYDTLLAVYAMKRALGNVRAYLEFPRRALLDRIGMRNTLVSVDRFGDFVLSSQVYSNARDLARFGLLYLNGGVWNGERLISEKWIDFVRTPGPSSGFGGQFWLNGDGSFSMIGLNGQSVQIVHNVVALPVEPRRVLPTRNQASKPPGDLVEGRRLSGDMLRW